ncbi:MAG: 2,3-bisphosphoglycerate-independent phosphoglycerate mutase [Acidobacteria bacterium]|nr:2,3-bisphosphoglycerate-independent phosphoglycerate mutase [Acidobacteriota bacterium]
MDPERTNIGRPVALVILDGWGYAPRTESNAIAVAHTPYYDEICRRFPMTTLATAMPNGEPSNSEIGHLNIGTGRLAQTDASRIKQAISNGEFQKNEILNSAFKRAKERDSAVHLVGLLSDGGVHSSPENLFALLRLAKSCGLQKVFIHGILDGLDVAPRTADVYVEALEIKLADIGLGQIATLCGRFFAMDSGEHWERTARTFTLLVHAEGERNRDPVAAIRNSFLRGISDEFIAPVVIERERDIPVATVRNGDLVVFFNHRADGMRQLTRSLCVPEGAIGTKPEIDTICLTEYDAAFGLPVAFTPSPENNSLVDVLASHRLPVTKITESVRSAEVTTSFDGGTEALRPFEHEVILPPLPVGISDAFPESQSFKIADRLIRAVETSPESVFVVNIPAAGIMSETGDFERTVSAIQFVDTCLGGICERIERSSGVVLVTSSYGSAEAMSSSGESNSHRAPTINPVPFHLIDHRSDGISLRDEGTLADIAPTVLAILGIEKPAEMTGADLRIQ